MILYFSRNYYFFLVISGDNYRCSNLNSLLRIINCEILIVWDQYRYWFWRKKKDLARQHIYLLAVYRIKIHSGYNTNMLNVFFFDRISLLLRQPRVDYQIVNFNKLKEQPKQLASLVYTNYPRQGISWCANRYSMKFS